MSLATRSVPGAGAPLSGRVAVVTGATGGIGRAFCLALGLAGAKVVAHGRTRDRAAAVAEDLRAEGIDVVPRHLDVSDHAAIPGFVQEVYESFGRIDVLVNNAALMAEVPKVGLTEVTLDSWRQVMAVNVEAPLVFAQAVVPIMRDAGGGKIVNVASDAAFLPGGLYRVSKHTLVAVTAGLAADVGKYNINVNAIAPGLTHTEGGQRSAGVLGSERRTAAYASVPHARPDRAPADLTGLLLLLATDAGDFIHGQTIVIDGGRVMRL